MQSEEASEASQQVSFSLFFPFSFSLFFPFSFSLFFPFSFSLFFPFSFLSLSSFFFFPLFFSSPFTLALPLCLFTPSSSPCGVAGKGPTRAGHHRKTKHSAHIRACGWLCGEVCSVCVCVCACAQMYVWMRCCAILVFQLLGWYILTLPKRSCAHYTL